MNVVFFFLGVVAGAILTVVAACIWLERNQAEHFDRMLDQIRSLGPRA